ncbi:heme-binding protein [Phenylobacterium sp.]|uniref:GlcG/HbpS family heme-binding protein n=1 Tax=Phenylobacterium sp. TaxID=1871053 RepID=UPI0025D844B9|nr:heme-binding protein [Phenylobacterium sp.]
MSITLAEALKLAQGALAEAEARGVTKISVVVTDPGGHVRVAMRTDGQGIFGVDTAIAKAVTALGFNRATLALTPLFTDQATAAISGATGGRFAPLGGGVVVTDRAGVIVAGAAVSGGLPDVDHAIIVAAIEAQGLLALP